METEMATHSSILAWRTLWRLVCYSPWGHKKSNQQPPSHFWAQPACPDSVSSRRSHQGFSASPLLPWGLGASLVVQMVKNLPAMWETWVRSLGREDSPGGRNCNPLQYSCLEKPMDRGACQATVHGVTKSQTPLRD